MAAVRRRAGAVWLAPTVVFCLSPTVVVWLAPTVVGCLSPIIVVWLAPTAVFCLSPIVLVWLAPTAAFLVSPGNRLFKIGDNHDKLTISDQPP